MMGAIGTGNTSPGVITASFGTSGTIYACAEKAVIDPLGEIAAFCDSTNRWMPLLCTMNVTVATEMVRQDFKMTHEQFAAAAAKAPAGSNGLLLLPYLEGERTPNVPDGTGTFLGVKQAHLHRREFRAGHDGRRHAGHELRSASSGRAGRQTHSDPRHRRRSQIQALAANHGRCVQRGSRHLKVSGGAAYGAAMQALWCWRLQAARKWALPKSRTNSSP